MADFKFNCPHCNQELEALEDMLGQTIACPSCEKNIILAAPAPDFPPAIPPVMSGSMPCPYCGEDVLVQAKKCKHCGEFLDDALRKKADEQAGRTSYNPLHQVQGFVRWFTGLGRLSGFRVGCLLSGAFKRRSHDEVELYFLCGGPHTTPELKDVPTEWPRPWYFWRLLVFGTLILIGFRFGFEEYQCVKLLPGLIIVGGFFVPLACGMLFFEFNVLRNISLFQILKYIMAGGVVSLLASLFMYQFSGLIETFLGATSAGIVEETAKLLTAVFLLRGQAGKRWILNGVAVGAAVGVGFAGFESAGYIFEAGDRGGVSSLDEALVIRAVVSPFCHVVWTAATAGALWRVVHGYGFSMGMFFEWKFLRVFLFVVMLHMFWNSGLLFSMQGISFVYGWILSILGSWYLILLITQEGLDQVKAAKISEPPQTVES